MDYHDRVIKFKEALGILRIPIGIFFMVLGVLLVITPLTPGSWLALFIGLELLNLRERTFNYFKSWRKPKD